MAINTEKSKIMIFNYTKNHQFTTRLSINNVNLEVVNQAKLLGTHITNDLKWDVNTRQIIRKSNARMQLLQKIVSFGATIEDALHIYKIYVRSALEFSSSVWHTSLTKENEEDLERIQKSAFRVILGNEYTLDILQMETLKERRQILFQNFRQKSLKLVQMGNIIKEKNKEHIMNTRNKETFEVTRTNTERSERCTGIRMQKFLNEFY